LYITEIVSIVLTALITGLVNQYVINPKAKLKFGYRHGFCHLLKASVTGLKQDTYIYTRSIWIQNNGKTQAKNLQIIPGFKPYHFEFWPSINSKIETNNAGKEIIVVDYLSPKENVSLEFIAFERLPEIITIKYDGGVAKQVNLLFFPQLPTLVNWLIWIFLILGLFTFLYLGTEIVFRLFPEIIPPTN